MAAGAGYFDREYFELHAGKRRYCEYLVGRLRRLGLGAGRVLDVGSGFGFFLDTLAGAGYRPAGAELSVFAASTARRRSALPVVAATAETTLPFRAGAFDAVTVLDVIEHLEEYQAALRDCARVLRPGGRLLVVTLNRYSAARPLLGRRWSWYQDPTHVHLFSARELAAGLRRAGFREVRSTTLLNFCSVGESTPFLKPLRRIARVIHLPALGDAVLVTGSKA